MILIEGVEYAKCGYCSGHGCSNCLKTGLISDEILKEVRRKKLSAKGLQLCYSCEGERAVMRTYRVCNMSGEIPPPTLQDAPHPNLSEFYKGGEI